MDNTKITHISLCTGYGGIDLGLRRVFGSALHTVAYSEIETYAVELLLARMEGGQIDAAPIWPDLKSFPYADFCDRVDILSGGYPCQPFSAAGKRLGASDERHLWPFIANGIRLLRPRLCLFENVEGHISLGLPNVIEDLAGMGYRTTWGIFSAAEVGAPHQRKRVFVLAHRNDTGLERYRRHVSVDDSQGRKEPTRFAWPSRPGFEQIGWEPPRVVANSNSIDWGSPSEGRQHDAKAGPTGEGLGNANCTGFQERTGESIKGIQGADSDGGAHQSWKAQPSVGGDADGPTHRLDYAKLCVSGDNRTDELRMLGNGVVPATAERAFKTLFAELNS